MMSSTERPAKRARLEADKRRAALAKVQDKYADIDFTRFQKVVAADAAGEATPHRFVLVRPAHHFVHQLTDLLRLHHLREQFFRAAGVPAAVTGSQRMLTVSR